MGNLENIRTNKKFINLYHQTKRFEDKIGKQDLNRKIRDLINENTYRYSKMVKRKPKHLKLEKVQVVKSTSYDFTVEKLLNTTDEERMVEFGFDNYKN